MGDLANGGNVGVAGAEAQPQAREPASSGDEGARLGRTRRRRSPLELLGEAEDEIVIAGTQADAQPPGHHAGAVLQLEELVVDMDAAQLVEAVAGAGAGRPVRCRG